MLSADLALKQQMATKQSREVTIWEGFWVNDSSIICRLSLLMIFERDCGVEFGIYGQYLTCTIYINLAWFCLFRKVYMFVCWRSHFFTWWKESGFGVFSPISSFFFFFGWLFRSQSSICVVLILAMEVIVIPQIVIYKHLLWACGKKWTMKKNISQKCVIFLACSGGRGFSAWQIIADF